MKIIPTNITLNGPSVQLHFLLPIRRIELSLVLVCGLTLPSSPQAPVRFLHSLLFAFASLLVVYIPDLISHTPNRHRRTASRDRKQVEIDLFALPFHKAVSELERCLIGKKALKEAEGNKSDAANRLQINRRLLYKKLEEHKIEE